MADATDDGLSPLEVPRSAPTEGAGSGEGPQRPCLPRTPPGVWPPVAPADMGRMVRKLKLSVGRPREGVPLLEGAA